MTESLIHALVDMQEKRDAARGPDSCWMRERIPWQFLRPVRRPWRGWGSFWAGGILPAASHDGRGDAATDLCDAQARNRARRGREEPRPDSDGYGARRYPRYREKRRHVSAGSQRMGSARIGIDQPPEKFVAAIREFRPQVVGLSGLLTLAFEAMKKTVRAIEEAGLRDEVRIMVGGGQVTEQIKSYVGADAFGPDAVAGLRLVKQWMGGQSVHARSIRPRLR